MDKEYLKNKCKAILKELELQDSDENYLLEKVAKMHTHLERWIE